MDGGTPPPEDVRLHTAPAAGQLICAEGTPEMCKMHLLEPCNRIAPAPAAPKIAGTCSIVNAGSTEATTNQKSRHGWTAGPGANRQLHVEYLLRRRRRRYDGCTVLDGHAQDEEGCALIAGAYVH